jgi:hypothetical protein
LWNTSQRSGASSSTPWRPFGGTNGAPTPTTLRRFLAAPPPPFPGHERGDDPPSFFPRSDDAYRETFASVALRIVRRSRSDAEMVIDRFVETRHGSLAFRAALEQELRSADHNDLAERINEDLRELAAQQQATWSSLEKFRATERHLLGHTMALAPPAVLRQTQLRRLDELADFHVTAVLGWIRPGWELCHPNAGEVWIHAVAQLGGFDVGVLAAQAALVLEDPDGEDGADRLLGDGGKRRPMRSWGRVERPEETVEALADGIGCLPYEAWDAQFEALGSSPVPIHTVSVLEAELGSRRLWARALTALILVVAAEQTPDDGMALADRYAGDWLDSDDVFLRHAAAAWWSFRFPAKPDALLRSLNDPDAGVRRNAIAYLHHASITPEFRTQLERVRGEKQVGWVCQWCGEHNGDVAHRSCTRCSTVGPNVYEVIDTLLGNEPPAHPFRSLSAPTPRRVRRFTEPRVW